MNTMYSNFTWKNDSLNHWNLGVFSNPLDKSKGELLQHSELGAPSMPAAAWSKLEQPRLEHHYHKDIQTPGKTFVFKDMFFSCTSFLVISVPPFGSKENLIAEKVFGHHLTINLKVSKKSDTCFPNCATPCYAKHHLKC